MVAEMIGLDPSDPDVSDMLAHYRLMFASEPNVNGRNRGVLGRWRGGGGGRGEGRLATRFEEFLMDR